MADIVDAVFAADEIRQACRAAPTGHVILRMDRRPPSGAHVRLWGARGGPLGVFVGDGDGYIIVDFLAAEVLAALDKAGL